MRKENKEICCKIIRFRIITKFKSPNILKDMDIIKAIYAITDQVIL